MSNLIFNLRILYWHLQITRDSYWPTLSFNPYQWEHGIGWRLIQLYRLKG